jgi:hypothetical protein
VTSARIDPNDLPLYNFNNYFSVGVLTAGSAGLLCGEDQPLCLLLIMFHYTMSPAVGFCIGLSFRKTRLLKRLYLVFCRDSSFVTDSRFCMRFNSCNRLLLSVWNLSFVIGSCSLYGIYLLLLALTYLSTE